MVDRFLSRTPAAPRATTASEETANAAADGASPEAADPIAQVEAAVWARVQLARAIGRPRTLELLSGMADESIELHGDRLFREDEAIVGGLATIGDRRVMVIGHQKGAGTEENIRRNFGMAHPEGYRKAMRLMELAERFRLPVLTLVDTPGASPGAGAEERGVAEAIARSIGLMTRLRTPIVTVITGEGGSGGALAIAVGDVVIALENAVYSVITPEGCASILWRTPDLAARAAVAMRMTAEEQKDLGVIDVVVEEPEGGAQRDHAETARRLRSKVLAEFDRLEAMPPEALLEARYRRYRSMGLFDTVPEPPPILIDRPGFSDRLRGLIEQGRQTFGGSAGGRPRRAEPPARDEV